MAQVDDKTRLGDILDGTESLIEELLGIVEEIGQNLIGQLDELRSGGAIAVVTPELCARLAADRALIGGAGVALSERLAGEAERIMEWWMVPRDGGDPHRLRVSYDADSVDFYDYVDTDWYRSALSAGGPVAIGPYVDALGTDENVITLSIPLRDGELTLGVGSLDVRAAELSLRLRDQMRGLSTRAALINTERRVIASTSVEHLPGTLLADGVATLHTGPLTGWQTVVF